MEPIICAGQQGIGLLLKASGAHESTGGVMQQSGHLLASKNLKPLGFRV